MKQPRNLNIPKLRQSGRGGSHEKRGKGRTKNDNRSRATVRSELSRRDHHDG